MNYNLYFIVYEINSCFTRHMKYFTILRIMKMGTLSKVQNIAVFGTRTYKFYVWYKSLDYFHASLNEIKNQNKWFSFVSFCKHANFYFPSPMKIYLWLCTFHWFCDGTFIAFWSVLLLLWCFVFISICKCNFVLQAISFL